MAFTDALRDSATFYTTTTSRSGGIGADAKTQTALYSNIRCRVHKTNVSPRNIGGPGKGAWQEYENMWTVLVESQYSGGARGGKVVVNGQNYLITKKHEIRGSSSAVHHICYYLQETDG